MRFSQCPCLPLVLVDLIWCVVLYTLSVLLRRGRVTLESPSGVKRTFPLHAPGPYLRDSWRVALVHNGPNAVPFPLDDVPKPPQPTLCEPHHTGK